MLFSEREAEEQAERERLRKIWLREQEQIRSNSHALFFQLCFLFGSCSRPKVSNNLLQMSPLKLLIATGMGQDIGE